MSTQLDTSFLLEAAALGFRGTVRALGKLLFRASGRLPSEVVIGVENGRAGDVAVRWADALELETLDRGKYDDVVHDQSRVVARICERVAQRSLTSVRITFSPTRGPDSVGFDLVESIEVE
jgi:hypothetical protein